MTPMHEERKIKKIDFHRILSIGLYTYPFGLVPDYIAH